MYSWNIEKAKQDLAHIPIPHLMYNLESVRFVLQNSSTVCSNFFSTRRDSKYRVNLVEEESNLDHIEMGAPSSSPVNVGGGEGWSYVCAQHVELHFDNINFGFISLKNDIANGHVWKSTTNAGCIFNRQVSAFDFHVKV